MKTLSQIKNEVAARIAYAPSFNKPLRKQIIENVLLDVKYGKTEGWFTRGAA